MTWEPPKPPPPPHPPGDKTWHSIPVWAWVVGVPATVLAVVAYFL